jgi:hypothetical protein
MRTRTFIAALSTLLLAACAHHFHGHGGRYGAGPDPARPQVFVVSGQHVVVSPEPLVFPSGGSEVTIVWQLPRGGSFRFPENGIVIDGAQEEIVRCAPRAEGLEFSCLNRHTRPGKYKYTIRVLDGSKPLAPLDPYIVNY